MKTWSLFCFFPTSLERQESVATTEARLRMEGVELKEEWQDEDFPGYSQTLKNIIALYPMLVFTRAILFLINH